MKILPIRTLVLAGLAALLMMPAAITGNAAMAAESIDDTDITLAIERELRVARGVSVDRIDVETSLGVVTLSGQTDNLLARDRAERIASTVKGVRSVVNQIQVKPEVRSDLEIQDDVKAALARDEATDSWEIGVMVTRGKVLLTGEVNSWRERSLAEKIATGVKGVAEVENDIDAVSMDERLDAEIHNDIEAALQWDSRIDDALIVVGVDDGRVTLTGTVGSAYEKSLAESKAHVSGVKSVDSEGLKVEWWARDEMLREEMLVSRGDDEVEDAVRDALFIDPRVNSFRPEVEVRKGVVTLTGTVATVKAKRAAAQDAANTTGVWRVRNYLKVRPTVERSDHEIAEDIRAALLADPYVERFEIEVIVSDGTVTLTGIVDSRFEKWHAEDLVARTRGVSAIKNFLTVSFEPLQSEIAFYDWDPVDSDSDFEPLTVTPRADWEIRQDVKQEMFWSPFVDADQVEVTVDDGIATLSGTVDSWSERRRAEEEALEGGALAVDNDLQVRWSPDLPIL